MCVLVCVCVLVLVHVCVCCVCLCVGVCVLVCVCLPMCVGVCICVCVCVSVHMCWCWSVYVDVLCVKMSSCISIGITVTNSASTCFPHFPNLPIEYFLLYFFRNNFLLHCFLSSCFDYEKPSLITWYPFKHTFQHLKGQSMKYIDKRLKQKRYYR